MVDFAPKCILINENSKNPFLYALGIYLHGLDPVTRSGHKLGHSRSEVTAAVIKYFGPLCFGVHFFPQVNGEYRKYRR